MNSYNEFPFISVHPHHSKQTICGSRAKYREGRRDTAVKVYTINQESMYLLISNVPAVGCSEELQALCDSYGSVVDFKPLDDYPCEEFTEVYLVKYGSFQGSRIAKKHLDDKSFLGGVLHVCYAPEFETVQETRMKLQERRKYVAYKTDSGKKRSTLTGPSKNLQPSTSNILPEPVTYVWAGKEYTVQPQPIAPIEAETQKKIKTTPSSFVPRQLPKLSNSHSSSIPKYTYNTSSVQNPASSINDSSYQNTMSSVRERISRVSVPNVRVSLKRKRRV